MFFSPSVIQVGNFKTHQSCNNSHSRGVGASLAVWTTILDCRRLIIPMQLYSNSCGAAFIRPHSINKRRIQWLPKANKQQKCTIRCIWEITLINQCQVRERPEKYLFFNKYLIINTHIFITLRDKIWSAIILQITKAPFFAKPHSTYFPYRLLTNKPPQTEKVYQAIAQVIICPHSKPVSFPRSIQTTCQINPPLVNAYHQTEAKWTFPGPPLIPLKHIPSPQHTLKLLYSHLSTTSVKPPFKLWRHVKTANTLLVLIFANSFIGHIVTL